MLIGVNPNIRIAEPFDTGIRASVSVCLVSRAPINSQIMETLDGFGEVIIGDGSHGVFGRYDAIKHAKYDIIYTQDDDCVVDIPELMKQWNGHFISNMKENRVNEYPANLTLIGWGAMFKKDLISVLDRYTTRWGFDSLFMRECDRVFTGLNMHKNVFVDVENLPNIYDADRLSNRPDHWQRLDEIKKRICAL